MANNVSSIYAGLSGLQPAKAQTVQPRTRTLGALKAQTAKQAQQQSRHQAQGQADQHSDTGEKSPFESRFESSFDESSTRR